MSEFSEQLANPRDLDILLKPADVLLVVPPFSHFGYASLACHLLQAQVRAAGFTASIFYANLALARIIGLEAYKALSHDYHQLIGERLFSRTAFDSAPFGDDRFQYRNNDGEKGSNWWGITTHQARYDLALEQIIELENGIGDWVEQIAARVAANNHKIVGCTNSFQQTTSSVAILNAVKRRDPEVVTLIGGSNCESEMAEGISSLSPSIDYIFSGESDTTFAMMIRRIMEGNMPPKGIVTGSPCHHLDALPTPFYDDYFEQLEVNLPGVYDNESIWISYETSRGCWWGEKSHCTFCGLNGGGMAFREKSPERTLCEMDLFLATSPIRNVMTTDNIMPNSFFKTLLPKLAGRDERVNLFYEIKPNLTLEKVILLHEAGVTRIQPGIEALSSSLLKRMGKGVTAAKNIDLLRFCRMVGLDVRWNLLCHFPGDLLSDWEQTLELTGLLTHLTPPQGMVPLSIDRFSPYHTDPDRYGITNLRPATMYEGLFPDHVQLPKIAYHFEGDYQAASREHSALMGRIMDRVEAWIAAWKKEPVHRPRLLVQPLADDQFLFVDTRGVTEYGHLEIIGREQAEAALLVYPSTSTDAIDWALERRCLLQLEGKLQSIALTTPELMLELQRESRAERMDAARHWAPKNRGIHDRSPRLSVPAQSNIIQSSNNK